MSKKKFKDTKVGAFLTNAGSSIVDVVGDVLPDNGVLGIVKGLLDKDSTLPPQDKQTALKLLEMDSQELLEVSKRWDSDMASDSWLSKNVRPLTLVYLTLATTIYIVLDSLNIAFDIDQAWIELLKTLLVTIYVAYFGSRGFEKFKKITK
jgi:hypothetical protein|tara:strand:- start:1092 stop:1541 length:450 start_codon:yes stop_codon:yes gene_type:complete